MTDHWRAARNHLLAMTALAVGLGAGLMLIEPNIGLVVAVPLAWLVGQSTGGRLAGLTGQPVRLGPALRLAGLAAAVHVGVFLAGLGLIFLADDGTIQPIPLGRLGMVVGVMALVGTLVTLGGVKVGAALALRSRARGGRKDGRTAEQQDGQQD